ncbi:MAG: glycoside hydrolase family 43 protein [Ruminococcus sp.]
MQYQNPILPGFHPDPSICRVGDDFYLVTSSFEYFPGLPIYHSRDLVHWEQIGHCLTRDSQVHLVTGAPNCLNIYAPTIRYHDGLFYVIVTNVTGDNHGNFIITAKDPAGEWSDPIALPFPGIDPSLFFDEDGKVYYLGTDGGIYLSEMDITTGAAIGETHRLWQGTANNPEGPHLYKIDGMYYLLLAQGGTELCHMAVLARSESILGPYEPCPHNPVLTNIGQSLAIKAAGHADLVEDAEGNWWAVCLGIRPLAYPFRHNLGRETSRSGEVGKRLAVCRGKRRSSAGIHRCPCAESLGSIRLCTGQRCHRRVPGRDAAPHVESGSTTWCRDWCSVPETDWNCTATAFLSGRMRRRRGWDGGRNTSAVPPRRSLRLCRGRRAKRQVSPCT